MSTATVILDYDGTLHDCIRIYAPAFRLAYNELVRRGLMPPKIWEDNELVKWLGLTSSEMWNRFAQNLSDEEKSAGSAQIGTEMVRQVQTGNARLYPGTITALNTLKERGYQLIFLSNCHTVYMQAHQKAFSLQRWFSGFFCAEDYGWKPKPEIFPFIQEQFPGPYIIVGDRYKDMEIASIHGLKAIGCAYGYGSMQELSGAEVIIQSSAELPAAIENLLK